MRRLGSLVRPGMGLFVAGLLVWLAAGVALPFATPRARAAPVDPTTPIQHVVIILKENRSYDEYFGQFPNANGATQGKTSNGTLIDLTQHPTPDPLIHDIGHS